MIYQTPPKDFKPEFELVICFFEYQGKILLLLRQDKETYPNKWSIPGGTVQNGESLVEALKREVKEETGINISPTKLQALKTVYVRFPECDFVSHKFYYPLPTKPEVKINPEEHKEFRWVTPEAALRMDLLRDGDETIKMFLKEKAGT